ncbi:hypothetical protein I5G58_gp099 [Mycobacterium phage BirdsNest]|uniref:Uncharacterized protein n=1 Tax=Mycobacterium phage BirdsNest TaxID=2686231 RepID=A0A6B9LD97_9CAUD|nr:hypothetical protein I5G58_gp099 [Mycobacterium phage BirdsNest]QHB37401.1 hypothetical protein PBI_BIRDSNEST_99 [Mycobacterium phage BirdsNest]
MMAKHRALPGRTRPVRQIVCGSSDCQGHHWIRTRFERREVDHPVHGPGVVMSWTPEYLAEAAPPRRRLRRREARSIRRARNVDLPALVG